MSKSGHPAVVARDIALPPGTRFEPHRHPVHQLAWAAKGVITITAPGGAWVLPATRALWIPAGVPHTLEGGPAVARAVYINRSPRGWRAPTVVAVSPLLRELAVHLQLESLAAAARHRAEAVLLDILEPVTVATIDVPMPTDPRAVEVARALAADPGDGRGLAAWGREVGASGRTLARLFAGETGMSFGRWRTNARLRSALFLLAGRTPVAVVARRVGYSTPSAFIAAFRQALGVSPGAYFT
jgi:AraC-like DNA-binding protein